MVGPDGGSSNSYIANTLAASNPVHPRSQEDTRRSQHDNRASIPNILSTQSSNEIYERHLMCKKHGFPLWIPQPNFYLPEEYLSRGVSIGDVGIITSFGAFDFLFNILLPAEHPIHPRRLPEGFAPLYPPLEPTDIRGYPEFSTWNYVASTSIEKLQVASDTSALTFKCAASEGAILTLPDGAVRLDLVSLGRFRKYAAKNLQSWYRYLNDRGWEVDNGSLRLVTGCDKTTAWGIATFSDVSTSSDTFLKFRPLESTNEEGTIASYVWEQSNLATTATKVGPEPDRFYQPDFERNVQHKTMWNQCTFVRALTMTLGDDEWRAISEEEELPQSTDNKPQSIYRRAHSTPSAADLYRLCLL